MTHRIVQIIPTLDQGGAEKQCSLLSAHLPRDEFEVSVCCLTRGGPWQPYLENQGIPVEIIGKRHKIDVGAYRRLKKYLQREQPTIVQTWLFAANAYGRAAAWALDVPSIIASERCVDVWKSSYHFIIDRYFARRSHAVVANTQAVAEFYRQQRIDNRLLHVIPNGIDVDECQQRAGCREEKRAELIQRLGIPSDSIIVGAVGRLWPQKRFKDLIWAVDLLTCVRDDIQLLIVGDGPQAGELKRYAEQVEIEDRIHFVGHQSNAAAWIGALDVLWSGSEFEGLSNVVMEAMALRVPVVATAIPGHQELIEPPKTGFLVPVGDRAAFVTCTRQLLDSPAAKEERVDAAEEKIRQEFSVTKMVTRYADLYRQLSESPTTS